MDFVQTRIGTKDPSSLLYLPCMASWPSSACTTTPPDMGCPCPLTLFQEERGGGQQHMRGSSHSCPSWEMGGDMFHCNVCGETWGGVYTDRWVVIHSVANVSSTEQTSRDALPPPGWRLGQPVASEGEGWGKHTCEKRQGGGGSATAIYICLPICMLCSMLFSPCSLEEGRKEGDMPLPYASFRLGNGNVDSSSTVIGTGCILNGNTHHYRQRNYAMPVGYHT